MYLTIHAYIYISCDLWCHSVLVIYDIISHEYSDIYPSYQTNIVIRCQFKVISWHYSSWMQMIIFKITFRGFVYCCSFSMDSFAAWFGILAYFTEWSFLNVNFTSCQKLVRSKRSISQHQLDIPQVSMTKPVVSVYHTAFGWRQILICIAGNT